MHIYHSSHDVVIFHTCIFFKKKKVEPDKWTKSFAEYRKCRILGRRFGATSPRAFRRREHPLTCPWIHSDSPHTGGYHSWTRTPKPICERARLAGVGLRWLLATAENVCYRGAFTIGLAVFPAQAERFGLLHIWQQQGFRMDQTLHISVSSSHTASVGREQENKNLCICFILEKLPEHHLFLATFTPPNMELSAWYHRPRHGL